MRVFCNECGAANDGQPGTKVMCTRCTAIFEVPGNFTPLPATHAAPEGTTPADASAEMQGGQPRAPEVPPQVPPATGTANWGAPNPNAGPVLAIPAMKTETLAVVSLILGIFGFMCCLIAPIGALVTGGLAIQKVNANPTTLQGKGLAIAGMIMGGISLAMSFLGIIGAIFGNAH